MYKLVIFYESNILAPEYPEKTQSVVENRYFCLMLICLHHNKKPFCQFKSEADNKSNAPQDNVVTFLVRIQEKLWQLQVDETDMNN